MILSSRRLFLVFAITCVSRVIAADAVVTFNELNYNPVETQDAEWIELHNQMAVNVDISGWSLRDGVAYTFPNETVIPGGGFLIVAKTPGHASLAGVTGVVGPFSGNLSNSGENLELVSRSGRLMDEMEYSDSGDWPSAADGAGASMMKRLPGSISNSAGNWVASRKKGGTPGAVNFSAPGASIRHVFADDSSTWRYLDVGSAPLPSWTSISFNDSTWAQGLPVFGTPSSEPVLTVDQGLVQRYRSTEITGIADGSTFPTWGDLALGDVIQQETTAGGNPTYRLNATPSGRPVVRFDGNDSFKASLPPGMSPSSGFVYYVVCKANGVSNSGGINDGSGAYILDRIPSANDNPLISLKVVDNRFGFQKRQDGGSGLGGPVSTSEISTTRFQIVAIRRNLASSRYEVWVDGVMESSVPDEGDNITPQPLVIGSHGSAASGGFTGDIAEVLVFADALTESDFLSVGAYLEARYGLDTSYPDTIVSTPLVGNAENFFRRTFQFSGDPSRTQLFLNRTVADGARFYLNGQEIARDNLPEGSLPAGTLALSDVTQPQATGLQNVPASGLVQGTNVLAVSLHGASSSGNTLYLTSSLQGTETPADITNVPTLFLSEMAPGGDSAFFVEIGNSSASPVSTAGYKISMTSGQEYLLPPATVSAGSLISYTHAQLGFNPGVGEKMSIISPQSLILDSRPVTSELRGNRSDHPGQWLVASSRTPGSSSQFALNKDVVINEICYGATDLPAVPGVPATTVPQTLLQYGSTWRYNQSGASLASDWAASPHPVGSGWLSGVGPLGFSNSSLPIPLGTTFTSPVTNNPYVITYYFESDFNLSAASAANLSSITINHLIDDGAVIYLNGTELTRIGMPSGTILPNTVASTGIANAAVVGPVTIPVPPGVALSGSNRISVEVHQNSSSSSDIVFGLQVTGNVVTDPGVPALPVRSSGQQWLELHNKGTAVADLSNWKFGAGITYVFPAGTSIAPGGYLILARDTTLVPNAVGTVLGPYSGNLSGKGERLLLLDAVGNPVDDLTYADGGRWPETADSGGSTLELRDPRSENSIAESWSASDESARRSWQTYTYRGVAGQSTVGPDNQWRDFIFGLLDGGEILIDDISVVENPDGNAVQMISGGNFESGTTAWRFLGNHSDATVVPDPENPSNHVLQLRATGPTEHMHNHVETTLQSGRSVTNGRTYEISFKARWLSGSNQLNTRLYFNRLAKITHLTRTQALGTPGSANSRALANTGPVFSGLRHLPVVPEAGENVTVSVDVADPDGVTAVSLFHSTAGADFIEIPMAASVDGKSFTAVIPGKTAGSIVRFYVSARDSSPQPATSTFPSGGAGSHALYQVDDGLAAANGLHNFRIIMAPADKERLYRTTNLMSNGRIGGTVIYNEKEVYYNVGIRLKSSQRGRQNSSRVGFNVSFNDDQLFRGVHGTVAIDRSEGDKTGAQEILYDHMMYASGGVPAEYNDLVKVLAPDSAHTSAAIMQMARFGSEFLDSQFDSGADGTVFEYELVYYPTTADANGYKLPQPDSVVGVPVTNLGDNKENYRWTYLIKNSEDTDDYSRIMEMAKLFDKNGAAFDSDVGAVLDVDQWLRALAYSCASGAGDSFFSNSQHNGQFYSRPSDGRVLYFPHDMDLGYNITMPIFTNTELQKLTVDGARRRTYLGHLYDICTTVFNRNYMANWTGHYGSLLAGQNFPEHLEYINSRSNYILSAVSAAAPDVTFEITSNGGADFSTTDSPVILNGKGWINVRNIRLAGSTGVLNVKWTSSTEWEATVPVAAGANILNLEAMDFSGAVVGADTITVTNSGSVQLPSTANLVVSEIYYNPLIADDTSEYIELQNISATASIDMSGLTFSQGIGFTFAGGSSLAPGARVVVVKNIAAFQNEFGTGKPIAGAFTGSLDNAGETITLRRADNTLVRTFAYSDDPPWPVIADTEGYSIVLISPFSNPDHSDPLNWRASLAPGGSPGGSDALDYSTWKASHGNPSDSADADGDGLTTIAEYYFGGNPLQADVGLAPVFQREAGGAISLSIVRRADVVGMTLVIQKSDDLRNWGVATEAQFIGNDRIPGSPAKERLTFRIPAAPGTNRQFLRFAIR